MKKVTIIILFVAFLSLIISVWLIASKSIQGYENIKYLGKVERDAKPLESAELPQQLKYLELAITELEKIKLDKFNSNHKMMAIVQKVVKKRIKGMSVNEARKTLKSDYELCCRWFKTPGVRPANAHFIKVYYIQILMLDGFKQLIDHNNKQAAKDGSK